MLSGTKGGGRVYSQPVLVCIGNFLFVGAVDVKVIGGERRKADDVFGQPVCGGDEFAPPGRQGEAESRGGLRHPRFVDGGGRIADVADFAVIGVVAGAGGKKVFHEFVKQRIAGLLQSEDDLPAVT